jgi:hypothetical protein
MAVVATLTKGYDLDYPWRNVDRSAQKSAVEYYLQAAEKGWEPPGRWWGPGANALGCSPGVSTRGGAAILMFAQLSGL